MTPAPVSLRALLDGVRRTLRRDTTVAMALAALSAVPGALLVAWLIALVKPWSRPGFGPLLLDVLVVGAAAAIVFIGVHRWLRGLSDNAVAADAEKTAGMREGSVRGVLELSRRLPDGTSPGLARRAEFEVAQRFTGVVGTGVARQLRAQTRRRQRAAALSFGVLSGSVMLLGFASPEHSRAAWAPLAAPVRNLAPPALPALVVQPGSTTVQRGADVDVAVRAPGRDAVTVHWRMQGDVQREEHARVIGGEASGTIRRVDAPVEYWVTSPDGATSPRYTITPADPLLLSELSIDVVFPPYVQRAAEHYQGEIPPLEIPEGTQLVVRGRTTRALAAAALMAAEPENGISFTVSGDRFDGTLVPRASGIYAWNLRDERGGAALVGPAPLEIVVVRDAPPQVEVTFPATDTVLDASMRQAIVAEARDDHGLAAAALVSWRVDRSGRSDAVVEYPIDMTGDDRALLRALLDATERSLVPGDTLKFFVRVTDSSPRRQTSESRTVALRLPGMAEMRQQTSERAEELLGEAARMAQSATELQQTTRDLQRRTAAANARRQAERQRGGESASKMDFNEASPARQMLERQEELLAQMEQMRENLDEFDRAMERAGVRDAELQKRLAEMREQFEQMLTPEMREQLEQLRKALDQLDPEALQKALEQMAEQQKEMAKQLETALEQMKRAAAEQEMNNLAQEARELATQQQALAESMKEQQPSPEQARTQQELAERAEQLAKDVERIQQQLREQGEQQTAQSTEAAQQDAQQAAQQMRNAARDAQQQKGQEAAQKGERAAEQLEQAAETLDQARRDMAESWEQQAQQSVQQAMRDALSLAEQQQQLLERMRQAEQQGQGQNNAQQPDAQQQGGQQGQQQGGQQQSGQQQGGQQQGQQQGGQQQGGQQGQQQGGQQQGQQQGGQQQGQQQGGQQPGGQQGQGGQMPGQGQQGGGGGGGDMQSVRSEQSALQQGLQQLGRNLQEGGENAMNREVGSSLARANLSMQQAMEQLQQGRMPLDQAQQTVDALNRLALSLLNSAQNMKQAESGEGAEATQQMADIAKQQGALNGRANALSPMDVSQNAMSQQLNRMSAEQMEIARRLGELNRGGKEGLMGDIDALAREAEDLARQLQTGRMPPEARARQERLFHRMLDAGRTLEKDEVENERSAERAPRLDASSAEALDPTLFRDPARFRVPSADELQSLPPAYRRLILDYFERLNRPQPPERAPSR